MKKNMILLLFVVLFNAHASELLFLDNLRQVIKIDAQMFATLAAQAKSAATNKDVSQYVCDTPLFASYSALQKNIPHLSLGSFPTPIKKCTTLERFYNIQNLYVKQDAVSGGINADGIQLFGGNKVRKLEFLLADALHHNAESVLTFGCIGSNHAAATATYAQQLGLRCYVMLTPQPDSSVVRRNLGLMYAAGAMVMLSGNAAMRADDTIKTFIESKETHGDYPYFIPTGGSIAIGAIGFVNAAFELREQIEGGLLPEPDYIYVATGSCGTTAGLALGLKAAGIQSRIIAICIEPEDIPGFFENKINTLYHKTNALLNAYDSTFPLFAGAVDNVTIVYDFCGIDYGVCTEEATKAIEDIQKNENICLDETYTGKAFSALLAHAQDNVLRDKNVLFWNTFCSDVRLFN